jgi:hypothetical protein
MAATFVSLFPASWWLAQVVPPMFYRGWNHDPRFFEIYSLGFLVTQCRKPGLAGGVPCGVGRSAP